MPFALDGLCFLTSFALGAGVPAALAALSLGGQVVYLLAGLTVVRAPLTMYRALGYAPVYIVWKIGLYIRALMSTRTAHWIRTTRTVAPRTTQKVRASFQGTKG